MAADPRAKLDQLLDACRGEDGEIDPLLIHTQSAYEVVAVLRWAQRALEYLEHLDHREPAAVARLLATELEEAETDE